MKALIFTHLLRNIYWVPALCGALSALGSREADKAPWSLQLSGRGWQEGRMEDLYKSTKNFYKNVQSSIFHNSPQIETTQISTNWWLDRQSEVYP